MLKTMKTENYQLLFESGDTYYDSAYGVDIDQDRAIQELKAHGITSEEELQKFFDDLGDKEGYAAQDVLDWLGY